MKALGYSEQGPVSHPNSVVAFDAPPPAPKRRDLVVEVRGVSVNPVDLKVRANFAPQGTRITGYDAAGVVREVGPDVTLYKPGDEVFYAGELNRPGSHAELQAVDERLAGRKPTSLNFAEAAAMPLTSITAWELLFDSFGLAEGEGADEAILIIAGAGGVGSILIQLARKLTALTVVASAGRANTVEWVKKMGAHHVVDHRKPLDEEMKALGIAPKYVAALNQTEKHFEATVELIEPRGHIGLIDDPQGIDFSAIKPKSLSFSWEFMFARSMFQTDDMDVQRQLLCRVADMLDNGSLIPTANQHCGVLSETTLREALAHQENATPWARPCLTASAAP